MDDDLDAYVAEQGPEFHAALRDAEARSATTKADERRLADLIAGNSRTEGELAAQGVRLGMDAVTQLQLRTLLRLLIPAHIDQMAWDLAYQESVREGLAEVAAQVKQQRNGSRLLVPNGAKVPPNLKG